MKKIGAVILICFAVLLLFGLFSGFDNITGQITKENIIISVSPQGEIYNDVFSINVISSEKANCMYALSVKNSPNFKYYTTMTVTGETRHTQLLKDLKDGDYGLGIKCSDNKDFAYTKDFDITIKIPETCVRYCEYTDDCDEYAIDGCGLVCKRDSDGIDCGENKVCKDSFCVIKEEPVVEVKEQPAPFEEPAMVKNYGNIFTRILSFLRGLFR